MISQEYPSITRQAVTASVHRDLERCYREWLGYVIRVLRRSGLDHHHAEDAAQEIFLKLFVRGFDDRAPREMRPWLRRVAVRAAISYRRRAHFRHEIYSEPQSELAAAVPSASEERAFEAADVDYALAQLPLAAAQLLRRVYFDEVPVARVSQQLGFPAQTIYARLRVARQRAMRQIKRQASAVGTRPRD